MSRIVKTFFIGLGLGLSAILLSSSPAWAHHPGSVSGSGRGGINTISADTLDCGDLAVFYRIDYLNFNRFSDRELLRFGANDVETDSTDWGLSSTFGAAWGVTDDTTLVVYLPYRYLDDIREPEAGEVAFEGDSAGIGDFTLIGTFRLWHCVEQKLSVSLLAGLEFPTGRTDDRTREGERFELDHQPGSGSWDPIVGFAVSKGWERWSFHSNATYSFVTDGPMDTNLGDIVTYNAAFVYRLIGYEEHSHDNGDGHDHSPNGDHPHGSPAGGHDHDAGHVHPSAYDHDETATANSACDSCNRKLSLDVMLEMNGLWEGKDEFGSELDGNSGGNVIYLSPGARLNFGDQWSAFFSAGFPVIQDVNGQNHEVDFRLTGGVSFSF
jgi:hypothetical protein